MPHILGEDDAKQCVIEMFDKSETIHTNIENGTYTGHKLEQAQKFETKLQHFTDKLNKELDAMIEEEDKLLA